MYPGIILYANIFMWKNLTCSNQKTLPLAATFWFLHPSYSVLTSPLSWSSGTSITSKVKSNQQEWLWHSEGSQTSQPGHWTGAHCYIQGGSAHWSPRQLAWARRPCTWAPGLPAPNLPGPSSALGLSPLLNCVVPGIMIIPNLTEFRNQT